MTLSMSSFVSAAEDIVLEDSGSPFIKTFDPGDKGDYIYLGYAYCFEAGPEYKYLKITYTGEKTAFDELRLEFVINSDLQKKSSLLQSGLEKMMKELLLQQMAKKFRLHQTRNRQRLLTLKSQELI